MKKLLFVLLIATAAILVVYIFLSVFESTTRQKSEMIKKESVIFTEDSVTSVTNELLIIKYGEYNGYPIELEYDSIRKRLSIKVHCDWEAIGDEELQFLKSEVSKIFTGKKTLTIGSSGYFLSYLGGYPQWNPYRSLGPNYSDVCLLFSSKTILEGKTFYVTGDESRKNYYPYADSVGVNR